MKPKVFSPSIKEVPFDISMGSSDPGLYNLMLRDGSRSNEMLNFFRALYDNNIPSSIQASAKAKIPRIIHQVWIGPNPVPEKYKEYARICQSLHPDWEYKFWGNDDVHDLLKSAPAEVSEAASKLFAAHGKRNGGYCGQKDVLEYLLLYKHGGIFLDMDIKCLQPLDEIVHKYKFFSALEPPKNVRIPVMTIAIVGSSPQNRLFLDTLNRSSQRYEEIYAQKNNSFIKRLVRRFVKGNETKLPNIQQVMMVPLTEMLMKSRPNEAIVFPATYFNPIFPKPRHYRFIDEIKYMLGIYKPKNRLFNERMPETIAIQDFDK